MSGRRWQHRSEAFGRRAYLSRRVVSLRWCEKRSGRRSLCLRDMRHENFVCSRGL
jgi:hypothetical protein